MTLGGWGDGTVGSPLGSFVDQWKTIAHEVGHLTTLKHGGTDHVNYKAGYVSLMNYAYETCPVGDVASDANGNALAGAAPCPIDRYSTAGDAVFADWENLDFRTAVNFQRSGQAFGDNFDPSTTPFPPPPEEPVNPRTLELRFPGRDTQTPQVQITSPAGGASFAPGNTIAVAFTATDNVAVSRAEAWFDVNGNGSVDESTEVFVATPGGANTFSVTIPAVSGPSSSRTLAVIAYDAQDNPGAARLTVNIGAVSPASIPVVIGSVESAARAALEAAGLTVGAITRQQSSSVPAGSVISQNPPGGQVLPPGSAVDLVISMGATGVVMANVVGMTQRAAAAAITGAGLVLAASEPELVPSGPPGGVKKQFPFAAAVVPTGTGVYLLVTGGSSATIAVPNVVGQPQASASSAITGAGLVVGTVTQQASGSVPSGSVISQNPAGGQQVASGTAVNLVVSSGTGQVSVPNVVGQAQAAAATAITGAGLVVGSVTQQSSPSVIAGNVIAQTPTGGQQASAGSAVSLVVSTGAASVSVPNVVGQTQAAANTALLGAGLVPGTVTPQISSLTVGTVISQSPGAGQQATAGTAVDLVVSGGPPVVVPSLAGASQTDAATAIVAAGLQVGAITLQSSATVPAGTVLAQTPPAGQQVVAGTAIALVISSGPAAAQPIPALDDAALVVLAMLLLALGWRAKVRRS